MDEGHFAAGLEVGQRVQSVNPEKGPQVGTVKYIGLVDGYEGLWIGVDWDSGRGRHNGTVNGRHYFDTSEVISGSLVRSHNLSVGVTLIEALLRRYNSSGFLKELGEDEMYVLSVRQKRMPVELVGKSQIEARQKQLQHLRVASLAYSGVNSAGTPGQICALVPNIRELDLTGNLLPDWPVSISCHQLALMSASLLKDFHTIGISEAGYGLEKSLVSLLAVLCNAVGKLCAELSSIEVLNLSCSRLHIGQGSTLHPLNIKTLVLNNCHITWKQVEELKRCLNSVEELHLCGNKISIIEASTEQNASPSPGMFVQGFDSLRLLNLEDNCLASWGEVMKLSKLKRLEHLNLNSNNMQDVSYPGSFKDSGYNEEKVEGKELRTRMHFWSLQCLLLGKNRITDWASIDALDKFPTLQDLRLSENPITNTGTGGAPRYMLIARIQKLTSLNGSEIKPRERKDAEIRYVRYVLSSDPGRSIEELQKLHPRLTELRLIHDVPVESAQHGAALVSQKMSATLLSITILCVSASVGEKPPLTKRLPPSTTVGKLKQMCEALFKLKATKQRLYVKDQDPLPVPLDNDLESLNDLGIGQGAVILVDDT